MPRAHGLPPPPAPPPPAIAGVLDRFCSLLDPELKATTLVRPPSRLDIHTSLQFEKLSNTALHAATVCWCCSIILIRREG